MKTPVTRQRIEHEVEIAADRAASVVLAGRLTVPPSARGIVLFAHGSGSSRFSPRNLYVADTLQKAALATLLLDLLTQSEEREDERTARLRFDIEFLGRRMVAAVDWVAEHADTVDLRIGLFGASTGAAAALIAAAARPGQIQAVVSRGGRPDLAGSALRMVQAPTLLAVGGRDTAVIEFNRGALAQLSCEKRLVLVPGATHLFEEPGTLEQAARLAAHWFAEHLGAGDR